MKKAIITLVLLFYFNVFFGQMIAKISPKEVWFENDVLTLVFDLPESDEDLQYDVTVEIFDTNNNRILPLSIEGDFGLNIYPGKNREIYCQCKKNAFKDPYDLKISILAREMHDNLIKPLTMGKAMLQSTIFPGWGVYSANNSKTNFLIGVACYSMLASAFFVNGSASASYEKYKNEFISIGNSDDYYDDALRKEKNAKILGISAATAWGLNYIWTFIKIKQYQKEKQKTSYLPNVNNTKFVTYFDTKNNVSTFGITYSF